MMAEEDKEEDKVDVVFLNALTMEKLEVKMPKSLFRRFYGAVDPLIYELGKAGLTICVRQIV